MKQEYPKYLFHKTKPDVIVNSKEEHDALETGYKETPFAKDEKSDAKAEKSKANKDETTVESTEADTKKVGTPIGSLEQPEVETEIEEKKPRKNSKIKKVK